MTIRVTNDELARLIEEHLRSGSFTSAEEVILFALRSLDASRTGADLVKAMQASPYREIELGRAGVDLPVREIKPQ